MGDFSETGVIAGSTYFSFIKRSILRYQSSKTSRVFLKDVMEFKHESITLSCLVRRAFNAACSILICFSCQGGGVIAPDFLRQTHVLFTAADVPFKKLVKEIYFPDCKIDQPCFFCFISFLLKLIRSFIRIRYFLFGKMVLAFKIENAGGPL